MITELNIKTPEEMGIEINPTDYESIKNNTKTLMGKFTVGKFSYGISFYYVDNVGDLEDLSTFGDPTFRSKYRDEVKDMIINYEIYTFAFFRLKSNSKFNREHSPTHDAKQEVYRIYSTVLSFINYCTNNRKIDYFMFTSANRKQERLYVKLVSKFLPKFGFIQLSENPISGLPLPTVDFIFQHKDLKKDDETV